MDHTLRDYLIISASIMATVVFLMINAVKQSDRADRAEQALGDLQQSMQAAPNSCERYVYVNDMAPEVCEGYDGSFPSCSTPGVALAQAACVYTRDQVCAGRQDCAVGYPYAWVFDWPLYRAEGLFIGFDACQTEDSIMCVFDAGDDHKTRSRWLLTFNE